MSTTVYLEKLFALIKMQKNLCNLILGLSSIIQRRFKIFERQILYYQSIVREYLLKIQGGHLFIDKRVLRRFIEADPNQIIH